MAAYIKTGVPEKAPLSEFYTETPLNRNDRWYELEAVAEVLEQRLYDLRTKTEWSYGKKLTYGCTPTGDKLEAVRDLRRQLAKIGIEQREITFKLNPRYVVYWGLSVSQ